MLRMLKLAIPIWVLCQLFRGTPAVAAGTVYWQVGSTGGVLWSTWTGLNLMADDVAAPGAIQPLELNPDQNVVPQLRNWTRYRRPTDIHYREGMPRLWRGIGDFSRPGLVPVETEYIDGDLNTNYYAQNYGALGGDGWAWGEFYTMDLGSQVPVDRFKLVPPEGADPFYQEPFDNYFFSQYQLTASNDPVLVERQVETAGGVQGVDCYCPDYYQPLDIPLASANQNRSSTIDIHFPLQYLRFLRMRLIPNAQSTSNGTTIFTRYALAELEAYGRGFVPRATWESKVIDLGKVVNIERVVPGISKWRREGDQFVPAPEASAAVELRVKTGMDDTPTAYYGYDDLGQPVEVDEGVYEGLKPRIYPGAPAAVGWRGPVADDQQHWSFWSAPIQQADGKPRVPRGRYFQLQVLMETDELWGYARLDSVVVAAAPLLAERVLGEVAVAGNLQPREHLAQVQAGQPTEFVYELKAEFSSSSQPGFDAVRVLTPAPAEFLGLEMGDPLDSVRADSLVPEAKGFVVYLPRGVRQGQRLRLHLSTAVYRASEELQAEVFDRSTTGLAQEVEAGDASEELGTDQLRVVAQVASVQDVLGEIRARPAVFTPQGDGVNDRVFLDYTLFRLLKNAQVDIAVYMLSGEQVWNLQVENQGAGVHQAEWDGRDAQGRMVSPGMYLARIQIETDEGAVERVLPIAVVY